MNDQEFVIRIRTEPFGNSNIGIYLYPPFGDIAQEIILFQGELQVEHNILTKVIRSNDLNYCPYGTWTLKFKSHISQNSADPSMFIARLVNWSIQNKQSVFSNKTNISIFPGDEISSGINVYCLSGSCKLWDSYNYLGAIPFNKGNKRGDLEWARQARGITHDAQNWYFSQRDNIYKVSVKRWVGDSGHEAVTNIPTTLKDLKYNRFGDIDYFDGLIYAPLQGTKSFALALFDQHLNLVDYKISQKKLQRKGAPWIAVNPINGLIHSSNDTGNIYVYQKIDGNNELKFVTKIKLLNYTCSKRIAGGAFSKNGNLYLSNDEGIFVFQRINDKSYTMIKKNSLPLKRDRIYEETKGLTIWDLDKIPDKHHRMNGHIHMILLNNGSKYFWINSSIDLRHYSVNDPASL